MQRIFSKTNIKELQDYSITVVYWRFPSKNSHYSDFVINNNFYTYLLIENGEAEVLINYKPYQLKKNSFIVISPIHVLQPLAISEHFSMTALLTRKSIVNVTPSMEKVFKQMNRSLKLFIHPVLQLNELEINILLQGMKNIDLRIQQKEHQLQAEAIQNAFIAFLLDWIHIGNQYLVLHSSTVDINRSEQILHDFILLLKASYKERHEASFYARELCLSTHHLNCIIKTLTGHTVAELVYNLLYCEACICLNQSSDTVEKIAYGLHFSDASAFCKFFKRRSGMTPLHYRQQRLM